MAKKIQFWMTDEEYASIEKNLVDYCNSEECSINDAFKSAVLEYFSKKPKEEPKIEHPKRRIL